MRAGSQAPTRTPSDVPCEGNAIHESFKRLLQTGLSILQPRPASCEGSWRSRRDNRRSTSFRSSASRANRRMAAPPGSHQPPPRRRIRWLGFCVALGGGSARKGFSEGSANDYVHSCLIVGPEAGTGAGFGSEISAAGSASSGSGLAKHKSQRRSILERRAPRPCPASLIPTFSFSTIVQGCPHRAGCAGWRLRAPILRGSECGAALRLFADSEPIRH